MNQTHCFSLVALVVLIVPHTAIADNSADQQKPAIVKTDVDYERAAEARIKIKYYNYIFDLLHSTKYFTENITKHLRASDEYVAKNDTSKAAPNWNISTSNEDDIPGNPMRVPNWFAKDDLKLFREGLDNIKTDITLLIGAVKELRPYYAYNGTYKTDDNKQYTTLQPKIKAAVERVEKTVPGLIDRAKDMANEAEQFLAQENVLGRFLLQLKNDLEAAGAVGALLNNPDLEKEGNTLAKDIQAQTDELIKQFKDTTAAHASISNRALTEDIQKAYIRFYENCADFAKEYEKNVQPDLAKKGFLSSSNKSRITGCLSNVYRSYDQYVSYYNYQGGHAIKRAPR